MVTDTKEGKKERKKKKRLPRIRSGLLGKQVLIMSICNEYRMKEWPSLEEALSSKSASLPRAPLYHRGVGWGTLTCIAPPRAHVGWQQRPFVSGRIVVLHRSQVAGSIIPSNHIQEPIHCTDPWASNRSHGKYDSSSTKDSTWTSGQ